jgi:hypothetical protein
MRSVPSFALAEDPAWFTAWHKTYWWWAGLLTGIDFERRRQQEAAEAESRALDAKLRLQIKVAGCARKDRSERWVNAQFMRWQAHHAAAFEVLYGKLTDTITPQRAHQFSANFHSVEYRLARRHHILMRAWGADQRELLCELLKKNDRFFAKVRTWHRLGNAPRQQLIDEIDAAFLACTALALD